MSLNHRRLLSDWMLSQSVPWWLQIRSWSWSWSDCAHCRETDFVQAQPCWMKEQRDCNLEAKHLELLPQSNWEAKAWVQVMCSNELIRKSLSQWDGTVDSARLKTTISGCVEIALATSDAPTSLFTKPLACHAPTNLCIICIPPAEYLQGKWTQGESSSTITARTNTLTVVGCPEIQNPAAFGTLASLKIPRSSRL